MAGDTSAAAIERRLSGLAWHCAQWGFGFDRKDRHVVSVLAGSSAGTEGGDLG